MPPADLSPRWWVLFVPKHGNAEDEYEDAFAAGSKRFAIADGASESSFAAPWARLLTEAGIVATPATGFGPSGEGFVRLTVCADKARLAEAVQRLAAMKL